MLWNNILDLFTLIMCETLCFLLLLSYIVFETSIQNLLNIFYKLLLIFRVSQVMPVVKSLPANSGDITLGEMGPPGLPWQLRWWNICLQCGRSGFDPWVRKIIWRRQWQPLQDTYLENPMDGGAWWSTDHGSLRVIHDWATSLHFRSIMGLSRWLSSEESACQCRRHRRHGLGRSGGEHSNSFQYPCLDNTMCRGAWQAKVHSFSKSQTHLKQLSTHTLIHNVKILI